MLERYNEHFPIEFADLLGVAFPFVTVKRLQKVSTARTADGIDKCITSFPYIV